MRAATMAFRLLYSVASLGINIAANAYTGGNAVYNLNAFVILFASLALAFHVKTALGVYLIGVPFLIIGLLQYGSDVLPAVIVHGLLISVVVRLVAREKRHREERQRQRLRDMQIDERLQQRASRQFPCPSCQRLNPVNVRFCGNCGAALVANA